MRNTLRLIAGIIALAYVVYSFFQDTSTAVLFGKEMNIWTYRLIWSLLAAVIFYGYFKNKNIGKS